MKVLVSGFEPFLELTTNPSQQVIERLSQTKWPLNLTLERITLPVSFKRSFDHLKTKILEFEPEFVIAFGVACSRIEISIERVAINLQEALSPDNDGSMPVEQKVVEQGPDGLFTQLPVKTMLSAVSNDNVACDISNTAGTYVCNSLMYQLLYNSYELGYKGGFIHLPPTPNLVKGNPGVSLDVMTNAIYKMISALITDKATLNLDHNKINTGRID